MGFLFLSVTYPSKKLREKFAEESGPYGVTTSLIRRELAGSATDDQWKEVMKVLRATIDPSVFSSVPSTKRALKPNDDNFEAFVGKQFDPLGDIAIPPLLAPILGDPTTTPIPHYEKCAMCTKDTSQQCSKCKIVKYCSRDCQANHWKQVHKSSCVKAIEGCSLERALQNNDGFMLTADECRILTDALNAYDPETSQLNGEMKGIIRFFALYFASAEELKGCFVL